MFLKNICLYFLQYHKNQQGIRDAVITTARPLTPEHRKEIFGFISRKFKRALDFHEKVDPDIIGGFVLQIEDQRINASLQYQLAKIKRKLINT
jgi:F-type H+-transporting ATPase subunit delta